MFLITNEDLSEQLFSDTVQLLNVSLEEKSLRHTEWPSLLWKIKTYTIFLVLKLSSSHWKQGEYLCQEDGEKIHIFRERPLNCSNWIFRNSDLTCELSDIPTFPIWKGISSPISHFINLVFGHTYLANSKLICIMSFMTHFWMHVSILQFGLFNCPGIGGKWKNCKKFPFSSTLLFSKGNSNSSIMLLKYRHGYVGYSYFLIKTKKIMSRCQAHRICSPEICIDLQCCKTWKKMQFGCSQMS